MENALQRFLGRSTLKFARCTDRLPLQHFSRQEHGSGNVDVDRSSPCWVLGRRSDRGHEVRDLLQDAALNTW